jgi:hypothetical protein
VEKRALLDVTEMIIKAKSTFEEKEARGMIICIDRELNVRVTEDIWLLSIKNE